MSFQFPSNPTLNQVYQQYFWDGEAWKLLSESREPLDELETKSFTYDGEGRVISIDGTTLDTTITYNLDGTVATVVKTVNGSSVTQTFTYDINGNLSLITVS